MLPRPSIRVLFFLLTTVLCPLVLHAVEPVQIVATGGRIASTFYTPATANTSFRQRSPHKLGGPVAEIQIGFMDWMYPYTAETPNDTNDVTIDHAWLERASTGQVVPLTFSGSRTLVLPMNSTTSHWLCDPIPSSAWTGTAPQRDEVFWLNLSGSIPTGGKIPGGATPTTYSGAKFIVYPPANDPGTYDTTGTVPAISGGTTQSSGLPIIFLGRYTEPGHLSVIGIGDSILNGSGDATNPVPAISGYGFFNRAAVDASGQNAIAMFNLTRHGQTASNFVTPSRQTRQTPILQYANVVVEEYGTNDLGQNGTGDTATIVTNLGKIWTMARAEGVQKILRTKLLPRTSDLTLTWSTLDDQTPNSGWESGGKRDTINAGLADAFTDGKIDILLDTLSVVQDPSDDSRWLTNGTSKYLTGDGTHPNAAGYALLALPLRAALLSLTVDENAPRYSTWASAIAWNGADSGLTADADGDGVSNLLAYALDVSPLDGVVPDDLPGLTCDNVTAGGPWLALTYRENTNSPDVAYTVQASADLATWTDLEADVVEVVSEVADANPDGDGSAVLRRVRVKLTGDRLFLRLSVRI